MTLRSVPEQRQFTDVDGRVYRMAVPEFTLNDRLARARTYGEYSQEQMATMLGVSRRTVVRYESEGAKVPRAVLLGYHVACMVDLQWLETGVPSSSPVGPAGIEPTTSTV